MSKLFDTHHKPTDDFMSVLDLWWICVAHWRWFVLSVILCLGCASYYLSVTPKIYTRQSTVMVMDEMQGKNAAKKAQDDFNDLALIRQTTSVENVLQHIASHDVVAEVVRRMDLADNQRDILRASAEIQKNLKVLRANENSSIINMKYSATSIREADLVLRMLVQVYNEKWTEDKNQMAVSTSRFIADRLEVIEKELANVDDSISKYKSEHQITNLEQAGDFYLKQQSQSDAQILALNNQKSIAQYLRQVLLETGKEVGLNGKLSSYELLPSNLGLDDPVTVSLITRYNTQLIALKQHLSHTSAKNSLIRNQERELRHLHENILSSIEDQIQGINIQLSALEGYSGEASSKISSNPSRMKHLVSVERQQKVKESLYLYLLQKQEENDIAMTYTFDKMKLINYPYGSDQPTSPVSTMVLMTSVLVGLILPVSVLFIRENLDNTVRTKTELENRLSIPIVGDVPVYSFTKGTRKYRMSKSRLHLPMIVVEEGGQDPVNEAFRIIRTNIEFMCPEERGKDNIYIVTSHYAGSGKTFVAMNLSVALAIKRKRVLFIDGDLRRASATRVWNCKGVGLSNYLSGKLTGTHEAIVSIDKFPTLSVLPVGTLPPNPTELLSGNRFADLLGELRHQYDIIIIDCPPLDNLADTDIIEKQADRTLFIVRAGLFERKRLEHLEMAYQSNRYKHLSIIMNYSSYTNHYGYPYYRSYYSFYKEYN